MSHFVQQEQSICAFAGADSWVILSPIEQSIKRKIEAIGTPLKDWDIQINYGIKTGCNEAFIVSCEKRDEILANCSSPEERKRTEELIRPILRGKDIKRYSYDWADLFVICARLCTDIPNNYPAVCRHLEQYKGKGKLGDNSTTKVFGRPWWAWMQEPMNYWEDFDKPKIVWKIIGNQMAYTIEREGLIVNNACYLMTGGYMEYLCVMLNSEALLWYSYITNMNKTGVGDVQVGKQNIIIIPVPKDIEAIWQITHLLSDYLNNNLLGLEFENRVRLSVSRIYGFSDAEEIFLKSIAKELRLIEPDVIL